MSSLPITQLRSTVLAQWNRLRGVGVGAVLVRGAAVFLLIQSVGTGLNFVLHVMLAREMGVEQYGHYAYVLNWLFTLVVLPKLGLDVASMRFLSVYSTCNQWGLLRGFLRTSSLVTLTTAVVVATCALGGAAGSGIFDDGSLRATFWAGLAILPVYALSFLWGSSLRGLKHVVASQIPMGVLPPLLIVLGVLAWKWLGPTPLTSAKSMWMTFGAAVVGLALLGFSLYSALPAEAHAAPPERNFPVWRGAAGPLFVMNLLQIIVAKGGILIVGAFMGTTEAGIYFAADRLASLMLLGAIAINSWAAPLIAELYSSNRMTDLQRLVNVGTRGLVAYSLPLAILMVILGRWILELFGPDFPQAYAALVILVLGQFAASFVGPAGFLPTMTGHQKEASWVEAAMTVLSLVLSLTLIPTLGIKGAAIASTISLVVRNFSMAILAWRTIGIRASVI